MYVKRLNKKLNQVEIAPRPGVLNARCKVKDIHWINNISINNILECEVRPRYRCTGSLAKILIENDSAEIIFNDPQFALAPGQAAVFYNDNEVLGGGWISNNSETIE